MSKSCKTADNYLEKIPQIKADIDWIVDTGGMVTIYIENKGIYNKMAQKLFKKPKQTQVHPDEMGSFIWTCIDGEKDIIKIGEDVQRKFNEKANPLYERLAKYIKMLESYGFIELK